MIYVVSDYEVIYFIGINWNKARESAIGEGLKKIDVWKHGRYSHTVDTDKKQVWPVPSKE